MDQVHHHGPQYGWVGGESHHDWLISIFVLPNYRVPLKCCYSLWMFLWLSHRWQHRWHGELHSSSTVTPDPCMVSGLGRTLFSTVQRLVPRDGGHRHTAGRLWIHPSRFSNCTVIIYYQYSANQRQVLQLSVGENSLGFFFGLLGWFLTYKRFLIIFSQKEISTIMRQGIEEMIQHEKVKDKPPKVYTYEKAVERYLLINLFICF